MEKIPTAEEFNNDIRYVTYSLDEKLITFAKLHVEAALKEASEKIKLNDEVCEALQNHWFKEYIDKSSILNSYSLDKIK